MVSVCDRSTFSFSQLNVQRPLCNARVLVLFYGSLIWQALSWECIFIISTVLHGCAVPHMTSHRGTHTHIDLFFLLAHTWATPDCFDVECNVVNLLKDAPTEPMWIQMEKLDRLLMDHWTRVFWHSCVLHNMYHWEQSDDSFSSDNAMTNLISSIVL